MTIIRLSETDAKHISKVRALLDEVARRDIDWRGTEFEILLSDSTAVESDRPGASSLLAAIHNVVAKAATASLSPVVSKPASYLC